MIRISVLLVHCGGPGFLMLLFVQRCMHKHRFFLSCKNQLPDVVVLPDYDGSWWSRLWFWSSRWRWTLTQLCWQRSCRATGLTSYVTRPWRRPRLWGAQGRARRDFFIGIFCTCGECDCVCVRASLLSSSVQLCSVPVCRGERGSKHKQLRESWGPKVTS